MRSQFSSAGNRRIVASSKPTIDEVYDLKGLNLVAPDQIMPAGETANALNVRRFADNDDETSIAIRTREGSTRLSTPVGETLLSAVTSPITSDIVLTGLSSRVAVPFMPLSSGILTKIELTLKKSPNTRGYVLVDIHQDNMGLPGRVIGTTSILPSAITGSYTIVPAYLIDAPDVNAGTKYWISVKMQELGVGSYFLAGTAEGTYVTSADEAKTWLSHVGNARYKTYVSTAGFIKGFTKRYPEDTPFTTMFAMGTKLYTMPNFPTTPTELGTDLISPEASLVRFVNLDERTFIIDRENPMRLWDGVAAPTDVTSMPSTLGVSINAIVFQNRLMVIPKNDQTRIDFSALYNFTTPFPSVNFFYIGRPKSPDWITAWHEFREGLTIFTKETKYTLLGSDIQTFVPTPHIGTKGAVSQEATAVGNQSIYFLSDDRHIYAWNGARDTLISFKVGPELQKILDIEKVRLHVYKNQLRVYYNRNPDPNVTHMLLYDIEQDQWFKDSGRPVMGSMQWTFDDDELVEFSSRGGALYFGERGYSDLGKPIDFKYWTAYKLYGSSMSKKRIKRFRPIVRPAESTYYLSVGKDINFQNTPDMRPWLVDSGGAPWGSFNWGDGTVYGGSSIISNRAPMSGRGQHIQYRFEHKGINQPVYLFGYAALLKIGRAR